MRHGPTTARILDEYLVASARAGDAKAFDLLARRWQKKLIAHAWRLTGDAEAARDAAQLGWIEIVRGLDRLQDERAFPAWAYRIVSRVCAKQIGEAVRRRRLSAEIAAQPEAEAGGSREQARFGPASRRDPGASGGAEGGHRPVPFRGIERRRGGGRSRRSGGHGEDPPDARAPQASRRAWRRRMMRDVDELIDEALDAEERELLRTLDEPGFFRQAFGVFSGPTGWMSVVMMFWQAVMFIAGVWAAWHFFEADRSGDAAPLGPAGGAAADLRGDAQDGARGRASRATG